MLDDQPYLADRFVNHAGEPVVLLAHEDRYLLEEARRRVLCGQDIPGALNDLGSAVSAANVAFGYVRSSSDVIHPATITYAAFLE